MSLVSVKGLSVSKSNREILKDISFRVEAGEKVAILGESGAGKTTLLQTLVGLNKAKAQELAILGINPLDTNRVQLRKLRSQVGQVSQGFDLVLQGSSLENVLFGSLPQLKFPRLGSWSYPKQKQQAALELMAKYQIGHLANTRVGLLSGGEKQRVAICRALMQEPQLLLADEPVSALDAKNSKLILNDLSDLAATGIPVIASLHQQTLALEWADWLLVLTPGRPAIFNRVSTFTFESLSNLLDRRS